MSKINFNTVILIKLVKVRPILQRYLKSELHNEGRQEDYLEIQRDFDFSD